MPATNKVTLRPLTPEERGALERLARARTAPARLVERARILLAAAQGQRPATMAARWGVSREPLYHRMHRFNDRGPARLGDLLRSGRPPLYSSGQCCAVIT